MVDVEATKWSFKDVDKNSKSFRAFNGRFDGNYRVRVIPKENIAVPGFIAVGPEKVMRVVLSGSLPNGEGKKPIVQHLLSKGSF